MGKNNKTPNNFGIKKSKLSVLPIIFSSVLAAGAIAGTAVSAVHIAKNYEESDDFTKSVSGKVKVDPFAGWTDAEKADVPSVVKGKVVDELQDCAEKMSRWLKDQGQKSYDVSYELYEHPEAEKVEDQYEAYLDAKFDIKKVDNKYITDEDKVDNDPYLSFFSDVGFNSNEKTIVYRWYLPTIQESDQIKPYYSVISLRDLVRIPDKMDDEKDAKVVVSSDGKPGVVYPTQACTDGSVDVSISAIYKNLKEAKTDSEKEDKDKPEAIKNAWGQPRLYIVNNLEGLYNEANYHLFNWWTSKDDVEYKEIYEGTPYAEWASMYKTKTWKGGDRETEEKTAFHQSYRLQDGQWYQGSAEVKNMPNVDLFNYVDQTTAGTNEPNLSFASKYIDEIVTYDEIDTFMPAKINDDYKNEVDQETPDIKYFWFPKTTKNIATSYLENQVKYGFKKASIQGISFSDIEAQDEPGAWKAYDRFNQQYTHTYIAPSFTETIFGGSNVIGALSIGFLVYLIVLLIILALLYRTTGVMSWITMMFALAMTLLIVTAGATTITMSLIFGMFVLATISFMACLVIGGRIKRRLNSREDTQLMIKKGFMKSLLPITDISVITLIFGVCVTYIAPIGLNALGLVLITGAFAIFISIFLLNGLIHGLFFNNNIMVNKYAFFGKPTNVANDALQQSNALVPAGMDATKLEFPYYSSMSLKKIDSTNKRALIAVSVIGGLLIAGIIVFCVLGFTSSSMFHTSSCIAVNISKDQVNWDWFNGINIVSYRFETLTIEEQPVNWLYVYTNSGNLLDVATKISEATGLTIGNGISIQNIFGSTNQDLLNLALIAILVSTLCSALYGAIRYNWISLVPMIATSFGMPLLILGLSAACQVKFDQYVVMAFVCVTAINSVYSAMMMSSIQDSWSRRDAYTKEQLKFITNTSLKNSWQFIWTSTASYAALILIFGLTAPSSTSIVNCIGLMIIAMVITSAFVPLISAFLEYQFMKVRNFALKKLLAKNKSKIVKDYDDIDEQGIEGINQFTKHIPVAKEPEKPTAK